MFTATFLGNWAPHSAIGVQSTYKVLHGTESDLRLLRVIGARAFVHIETYSKTLGTQGGGRTTGWVQQQQQELSSVQSDHPAYYGEPERHLHRNTIAPIPATVGRNFAAG